MPDTIDETTAQLILDALAWMDKKWMDTYGFAYDTIELQTVAARAAFVEFCKERKIAYIGKGEN